MSTKKVKTVSLKEFKEILTKLIKEEYGNYKESYKQGSFEDYFDSKPQWEDYFDNDREAGVEMDNKTLSDLVADGFSDEEILDLLKQQREKGLKECSMEKPEQLEESAPEGWEGTVKAMKQHGDKIDNPFALAHSMKNKGAEPHYKNEPGKPELKAKFKNESVEYKKKFVVLEHRKATINNIILQEKSLFDKLRGTVNPSLDVDRPDVVRKNIDSALKKAERFSKEFNNKVLANTSAINAYHEAVKDLLDKLVLLSGEQTWMPGLKAELEPVIISAARDFYRIMNDEKQRIETFQKQLVNDMDEKGFDKSMLTFDKSKVKSKSSDFKPLTPSDYKNNTDDFEDDLKGPGFMDKAVEMAKGLTNKISSLKESENNNKK
jgi:hypothetical protein